MAQKMDVEGQLGPSNNLGETRISRQQSGTQIGGSSSSGYGPVTVSRMLLMERQIVHEHRDDSPT